MMPARTKSVKSTGRSRSRSSSRGRRRSSSRTRKSTTPPSASAESDVSKKDLQKSVKRSSSKAKKNEMKNQKTELLTSGENDVKMTVTKTETEVVSRSRRTVKSSDDYEEEEEEVMPVRMTRGRERREREALECGISNKTTTSTTTFEIDSKAVSKTKNTVLGGPIFCFLLLIIIPTLAYYLSLMCSRSKCVPRIIKFPTRFASYFDLRTYGIFIGWIIFQGLLCSLPFGRYHKGVVSRSGSPLKYRCNGFVGFIISIFTLLLIVIAHIRWPNRIPSPTYVMEHFLALLTAAVITALVAGTAFYIYARVYCRQRDLNPIGNTGNWLYDAFVGHEMHPLVVKRLDMKFFTLSRLSMSTMGILVILMFIREYERRGGWSSEAPLNMPLLLVTLQQLLYVADNLFFEDCLISSFAMQHEGFGILHLLTRLVWTPFILTMPVRYLGNMNLKDSPQWSPYVYGIILFHLMAFIIRRGADSQKSDFRREPNHPAFSSLEVIPSTTKNLLAGGWWGIVRHPNYLGELMLCISWTLPCGLKMSTPWLVPIVMLFTMMGRIRMVEAICARRHGTGWQKYCDKVRSRLIPFIL